MTITGLENNYYLAGNDIWITVNNLGTNASMLEVTGTNITTSTSLPKIRMFPSPHADFNFNISQVIRALFPDFDHKTVNTLQEFKIDFRLKFTDSAPDDFQSLSRYFIRGGRNKNSNDEWFLTNNTELIVGTWIDWVGVMLPGFAKRIQGNTLVDFIPTQKQRIRIPNFCDYKIIKFLNSIGGIQYFVFEKYEIKPKVKPGKTISKITDRLRIDNFKNLPNTSERGITFFHKTPFESQAVISDLIESNEVYLYNPSGTNEDSKWERLIVESNDSIENNWDRVYDNKIDFSFSNYRQQW